MSCGSCNQAASLPQQIVNAGAAVARYTAAVLTAQPVNVSTEVRVERLAVCLACEHCQPYGPHHRCKLCGCWLDGDTLCKTCLTTETCPLNRWKKL